MATVFWNFCLDGICPVKEKFFLDKGGFGSFFLGTSEILIWDKKFGLRQLISWFWHKPLINLDIEYISPQTEPILYFVCLRFIYQALDMMDVSFTEHLFVTFGIFKRCWDWRFVKL